MKKIKELMNPDLNMEQIEKKLEDILKNKFDQEKILHYQDVLKNQYGIERDHYQDKDGPLKSGFDLKKIILLAVLIFSLLSIGLYFGSDLIKPGAKSSTENEILQYALANPIPAINSMRGDFDRSDRNRSTAIAEFEKSNFTEAIKYYEQIIAPTKIDLFYLAYSNFRLERYNDAESLFSRFLVDTSQPNGQLVPEANVYLILSKLQLLKVDEAKLLFQKLEINSWEYTQLKPFFN